MAAIVLPTEPVYLDSGDYAATSPKWAPILEHPGYAVARVPYPSTYRRRRCVVCKATGVELAFTVGALRLAGGWCRQGDCCQACAARLLGLDQAAVDQPDMLPDACFVQLWMVDNTQYRMPCP